MDEYRFSVVIPTRNRPDRLYECVTSIAEQRRTPEEVIVVNDGNLPDGHASKMADVLGDVALTVTSSDGPAGTSTAINTGVERADGNVVLVVGDDTILGDNYLARLEDVYENHDSDELAGVGVGATGADRYAGTFGTLRKWFKTVFYTGPLEGWQLNRVGMEAGNVVDDVSRADWITGSGASYKRKVVLEYPFKHWEGGREVHEDVEICWRLKNAGYHFLVDPELSYEIEHDEGRRHDDGFKNGLKKGRNRVRMFVTNGNPIDTPLFLWACLGRALIHFIVPFKSDHRSFRYSFLTGIGMILGVCQKFPTLLLRRV